MTKTSTASKPLSESVQHREGYEGPFVLSNVIVRCDQCSLYLYATGEPDNPKVRHPSPGPCERAGQEFEMPGVMLRRLAVKETKA